MTLRCCDGETQREWSAGGLSAQPSSKEPRGAEEEGPEARRQRRERERDVAAFVKELLMPAFRSRRLAEGAFRAIAQQATAKVMEGEDAKARRCSREDFLSPEVRRKIGRLVDRYLSKYGCPTPAEAELPPSGA